MGCTYGEEEEARVGDGVSESDAHRIQTLGRLVVDVAAHARDVVLAEVGVPAAAVASARKGGGGGDAAECEWGKGEGGGEAPAVCGAGDASVPAQNVTKMQRRNQMLHKCNVGIKCCTNAAGERTGPQTRTGLTRSS